MNFQGTTVWLSRLARMDFTAFDDLREDNAATVPSLILVTAASFLSGLGSWLWWVFKDGSNKGEVFTKSFILGSLIQVGVWLLWVYAVYAILTQVYRINANFQVLMRTMALAFTPMAISVLVFISVLRIPVGIVSLALVFLLSHIAIQSAVPTASAGRALAANLTGLIIFAIVMGLLANVGENFTPGIAPGIFFFNAD